MRELPLINFYNIFFKTALDNKAVLLYKKTLELNIPQ